MARLGLIRPADQVQTILQTPWDRARMYTFERVAERALEGYQRALRARTPTAVR